MKYTTKKHQITSYLYQFRTLSYDSIYKYIFEREGLTVRYCEETLKKMVGEGLIEKKGFYKNESFYLIAKKGMDYLKEYGVIKIGSSEINESFDLLPLSKIKINDRLLEHQASLARFVLRWSETKEFKYYDEKYISKVLPGARPDGLVVTDDYMYFLEMDMNTEGKRALNDKWTHYAEFLNSKEYYEMNKPVKVLFILGGKATKRTGRKSLLKKDISGMLYPYINKKFNFVFGTEDELFSILKEENKNIARHKFDEYGYDMKTGNFDPQFFGGEDFDFYGVTKAVAQKKQPNRHSLYEFVFDDYTNDNEYTFLKVQRAATFLSVFLNKTKRDINYVILVNKEEDAVRLCKEAEYFSNQIYFITVSRFNRSLHSALFQVDYEGRIWHFSDDDIKVAFPE